MDSAFKVISHKEEKEKYPELPFVVKDEYNDLWLVVREEYDGYYKFISLTFEDNKGCIVSAEYESLDEMFKESSEDKIMLTELKITGEYSNFVTNL